MHQTILVLKTHRTSNIAKWGRFPALARSFTALSLSLTCIIGACDRDTTSDRDNYPSSQQETQPDTTGTPSRSVFLAEEATDEQPTPKVSVKSSRTRPSELIQNAIPAWQPLIGAQVGQWVEYESLEKLRIRYEILSVKPTGVVTQVMVHQGGKHWGMPTVREDGPTVDPMEIQSKREHATRYCHRELIEAMGQSFDCLLYEDRWTKDQIPYLRKTWVSKRVPFLGTVRMELYGAEQLEAKLVLVGMNEVPSRTQSTAP